MVGMRPPAAGNALSCLLTWYWQGHKRKGLGLQALNEVKLYSASAEMIALLVVEGNCSRSDLKVSKVLTAAGRSECFVGTGYL